MTLQITPLFLVSHKEGQLHTLLQTLNKKVMLLRVESKIVTPLGLSVSRADNICNPSDQPNVQGDQDNFQLGEEIRGNAVRHLLKATLFTAMLNPFSLGFSP